jgi:hypothetical protein
MFLSWNEQPRRASVIWKAIMSVESQKDDCPDQFINRPATRGPGKGAWNEVDDRRILELRAAGRSSISIANALRRTVKAVNLRMHYLRARDAADARRKSAS